MPDLSTAFGLIAIVLLVSALISPLIERAPLSFPMIFLGLGFLLGPGGAGLVVVEARAPALDVIATLSLAFVLFLDAVRLEPDKLKRGWRVPALSLGPGTLLTIGLLALAARVLLGLAPLQALLLGTVLASTDPVVVRDVTRDRRIPGSIRRSLGIEAGLNDIVVLPLVLVFGAAAQARLGDPQSWLLFLARVFILGPLAGFAVGAVGSWLVGQVDARLSIRREYQALYGVGLVLAAYAAGVALGADGFLAAFAAGLAVTLMNQELCDCFLEYGDATAEMAMLLAFIFFGALLSVLIWTLPLGPVLLFSVLAIALARPIALGLVLLRARLSPSALAFIAWFGPRGLSSLLIALLLVHAGVPEAEHLLAIAGVVVIVSVVAHGVSATPLAAWYGDRLARRTLAEERESSPIGLFEGPATEVPRITAAELAERLQGPEPPIVLDVRSRSSYAQDPARIPGSVRVLPDEIEAWAANQTDRQRLIVAYCT